MSKPIKFDSAGEAIVVMLGAAIVTGALIAATLVLDGWYIKTIWNWLAVPAFGAAPISIPMAIAGATLFGSVTKRGMAKAKSDDEGWAAIARVAAFYVIGLLIAYVLKGYL